MDTRLLTMNGLGRVALKVQRLHLWIVVSHCVSSCVVVGKQEDQALSGAWCGVQIRFGGGTTDSLGRARTAATAAFGGR